MKCAKGDGRRQKPPIREADGLFTLEYCQSTEENENELTNNITEIILLARDPEIRNLTEIANMLYEKGVLRE